MRRVLVLRAVPKGGAPLGGSLAGGQQGNLPVRVETHIVTTATIIMTKLYQIIAVSFSMRALFTAELDLWKSQTSAFNFR